MRDISEKNILDELQTLSSFWRKNTSTQEAIELANLLKSLRKVVGHLGPNTGSVEYAGLSGNDHSAIIIDPAAAMGSYPVGAKKVDLLVGEVVHEALLRTEWSDRVWKILEPSFADMGPIALVKFQMIVKTAEDIYVDSILEGSVLGNYLAAARRKELSGPRVQSILLKSISSFDTLVLLWWAVSFGDHGSMVTHRRHDAPLSALMRLSREIVELSKDKSFVVFRCKQRALLYKELWARIEAQVLGLPLIDKRLSWSLDRQQNMAIRILGSGSSGYRSAGLSQELANDIELHLAPTSSDITSLIRRAAGVDYQEVIPTSRWDYHIPAHPMVDRTLSGRISAIFQGYSAREKLMNRGLTSGKLDSRRLHRAPVTGRCFKYLESRPSMDWNVTLLADASGSMRGTKWRMVENTVSTLHRALKGYRNSLSAFAYFEIDGICMVSSLIKDDKVFSVPPCGQTASGQAIIAAALFMPKNKRRRLLIHITDGESNIGLNVPAAIEYCRVQNIHLVTLGCGCRDMNAMQAQYGNTIEFIGGFRMLPQSIERLLRWTFLYGSRTPMPGVRLAGVIRKKSGSSEDQTLKAEM
jgi:hypothetical protein